MNARTLVSLVAVPLTFAACAAEKSATPLSPAVAGPIPGVNISAPTTMQPSSGARIASDQQPVTLTVNNATTSGVRPLTYLFEVASDASFSTILFSRADIAPGNGQTSLRLSDALAAGRTYFWHARAQDGANTGPYSTAASFDVFVPVVFQPPVLLAPINNAVVSSLRPRFSFTNAQRTGQPTAVSYLVEASDSDTFANTVSATVAEQSGQTSVDPNQDLPSNKQVFWRVRAFDSTTTGPWSATQVFRTPAAPSTGAPPSSGGPDANSSTEEWRVYFFALVAQKGLSTVSTQALAILKPDLNAHGADIQHDSAGNLRPRIFLPTGNPNDLYSRAVDVGDFGGPWLWIPR